MSLTHGYAYYMQSLIGLLGRLAEEPYISRLEAMRSCTEQSFNDTINVGDEYTMIAAYPANVTYECFDDYVSTRNNATHVPHYYRHLIVEWRDRDTYDTIIYIAITLVGENGPTVSNIPVKFLIVTQHEDSLLLADHKNLFINSLTDFKGKIFSNTIDRVGFKENDTEAVNNGIFDVSRVIFDGRLDHRNEIARLKTVRAEAEEERIQSLNRLKCTINDNMHKKYWGDDRLLRKYEVVYSFMAGSALNYSEYVQSLINSACSLPIIMGNNNLSKLPFSDCPHYGLGKFSSCIIDNLVPMFAINYVCLIRSTLNINVCVTFNTHMLRILTQYEIETLEASLERDSNRVFQARARAAERRRKTTKRKNPITKKDLSWEIEMD